MSDCPIYCPSRGSITTGLPLKNRTEPATPVRTGHFILDYTQVVPTMTRISTHTGPTQHRKVRKATQEDTSFAVFKTCRNSAGTAHWQSNDVGSPISDQRYLKYIHGRKCVSYMDGKQDTSCKLKQARLGTEFTVFTVETVWISV